MHQIGTIISSLSCAGLLTLVSVAVHSQTITTFDAPDSSSTVLVGINSAGQIAGYYRDANTLRDRGFLRGADGTFTSFTYTSGSYEIPTYVTDLNSSGALIGYDQPGISTRGYLRLPDGTIVDCCSPSSTSTAMMMPIPDPGDDGNTPVAINDVGQVAGFVGWGTYESYLRQPDGTGVWINLGGPVTYAYDINNLGQITGTYEDREPLNGVWFWHGYLREPNGHITTFDVRGSVRTTPRAIDQKGQIAGTYDDGGFIRKPNGQILTFNPIGSVSLDVRAMSSKGQLTGHYATADGIYHGFVRDRNGEIETFDVPGANGGTYPMDINDLGEIVGYYKGADSVPHGFIRSNDKDPNSHFRD